jgi:outer membrane murein-binding lipoprotein Lpp
MVTADLWPELPANPTWLFILALALVIGYFLLRGYSKTQSVEIEGLRKALNDQSLRHSNDLATVTAKVDRLEVLYDEQRSEKHRAQNELAKTRLALDIVRRLQAECTCGALKPLGDILANLADHGDI